jgi:mannan endo-1,4-beta-mannosidase
MASWVGRAKWERSQFANSGMFLVISPPTRLESYGTELLEETTMRTKPRIGGVLAAAAVGVLGLLLSVSAATGQPSQPTQAPGLHIENGRLVESNGNDFVMRGINHAHTWYTSETTQSLADIKATGANTVRVVLSSGGYDDWTRNDAADVSNVVSQCKENRLICVLEVHDTTGYNEDAAAISLDEAVDYWIDIQSALEGEEDYVIIDIGNEPWGNTNPQGWTADMTAAVERMRDAGFQHTLMVNGPNWGQDNEHVMADNAQAIYEADPTGNTIFAVHMYSVYDTAQEINDYLNGFVDAGLPISIGEFGGPPDQWGDPDEDTMFAAAERLDIGYLAWSWSGNTDPILDMVTEFNANQLTEWGERVINGANGIAETAQEATIFS